MALQQLPGGQFGAAIGGSDALREAFERRGADASVLDQMSPGAVGGAAPMPQNPQDLSMAQAALPQGGVPAAPAEEPVQSTDPELNLAIEALASFVKTGANTRRDVVKARSQGLI